RCSDPLFRADIHHLRGRLAHYHGDCQGAYDLLIEEGLRVAPVDPRRAADMLASAFHSFFFADARAGSLDQVLDELRRIEGLDTGPRARGAAGLGPALLGGAGVEGPAPPLERSPAPSTTSTAASPLPHAANCHGWLEQYPTARDLAARALKAARRDGAVGAVA